MKNYCFELTFRRPMTPQIVGKMMSVAHKEGECEHSRKHIIKKTAESIFFFKKKADNNNNKYYIC